MFVTQGAVTLSLQYSKTPHGIQRKKSLSEKGVFGVDIATVSRYFICLSQLYRANLIIGLIFLLAFEVR